MNFAEYTEGVLRTAGNDFPNSWQTHVPAKLYQVTHALVGLTTELGELRELLVPSSLNLASWREELGDAWWYAALLAYHLNDGDMHHQYAFRDEPIEPEANDHENYLRRALDNLNIIVAAGMDVVKRKIYYNAPDTDAKSQWSLIDVGAIIMYLDTIQWPMDTDNVWEVNLAKLRKRFPHKFSLEEALNRDLTAERKILEA